MSASLGNGNDTYAADASGAEIRGGNGDDTLSIRGNNNRVFGENGVDTLTVTGGGNLLDGGRGADRLNSNSGFSNNTLTGGQGKDTYSVNNLGDNVVTNNSGSTAEVVSQGDRIQGNFDQITDYEAGELLLLNATSNVGPVVGLDGFAQGHQHFELADGQYGIIRGELIGNGQFTVDSDGTDLLVVYDQADGVDDPYFQGAVALVDYTGSVLIG